MPAIVYTDRQLLKQAEAGVLTPMGVVDALGTAGFANTEIFVYSKAAADGAATTTAETDLNVPAPRVCILRAVRLTPQGSSVVADPTNNAVITITKRDATGLNPLTVATLTTNVAGIGATLAQRATAAFVLVGAQTRITAGSSLTFTIAKNGTGVVIPIAMIGLDLEWD